MLRIRKNLPDRIPREQKTAYAISCGVAYVPQLFGYFKYHINRLLNRQSHIIEYK